MSSGGRGSMWGPAAMTALQELFVTGMVTLAGVVATQGLSTSEAWTVVGLVALAAAAATSRTTFARRLGDRLSKISIGPVAIELLKKVEAVAAKSPGEAIAGQPNTPSGDVIDLQLKLERKLAYIAKHMLTEKGHASYVTIGSLAYDGYLRDDQARTASLLMRLRQDDLASLSGSEHKEFLEAADTLVAGIRATVFRGMVHKDLEGDGWFVRDLKLEEGQSRPDYGAKKDDVDYRIVPVFATDTDSRLLKAARARLHGSALKDDFAACVVVLPSNTRAFPEGEGDPRVVRLDELAQFLEAKPRSDDTVAGLLAGS
jgi:hypothetical protein